MNSDRLISPRSAPFQPCDAGGKVILGTWYEVLNGKTELLSELLVLMRTLSWPHHEIRKKVGNFFIFFKKI